MGIIPEKIEQYIDEHCSEENELLYQINRKTFLQQMYPQMISGKVQGQFLKMISRLLRPKRILEIGTFTAYSTICLAAGLAKDGQIDTIELDEELKPIIDKNLQAAGIAQKVNLHIGEAQKMIPELNVATYDLIFLDADKEFYPKYYRLLQPLMQAGSFLLVDNVLWYGKVAEAEETFDPATKGVVEFNKLVQEDPSVENVILSVRDGLMLVYKL